MKFLKKEDPGHVRRKTLLSKRKRDSKLCQQKKVKDIKDSKKVITNGRLTVPHMQPGIFLKGKSTVSYQRVKGAKLNALNKARMNENLAQILNFAKDSKIDSVISHGDESGGKSKFHPRLDDIKDEETLSLQISQDASKNEYGQNPYKNKLEIFLSSEDSSDEEKNEPKEHSDYFFQNASNKNIDESEEEFDGESKYIEFKRFLTYFDAHVYLEDPLTDLITVEMTGITRKLRKGKNSGNSPRNEDIKNASYSNHSFISELNENSVSCVKFSKNIKNTKIKIPKKDINYNMFQNRKPEKITIVKQMRGKEMTEATQNSASKNMSRKFPFTQNKSSNFETNEYKIDYLSNKHEASQIISPIKHSVQTTIHPNSSLSMLDPLHFLEVTMSQPDITQTFSGSSETSIGETINFKRDKTASAFSAPPDLCEETPMPQFQDHSLDYFKTKSETKERKVEFYDWFNPCKINDPSPSNFISNESKFICHKTEDKCRKKSSKDLFHLFDQKEKSFFPSSQNFVFSPEATNGLTNERSSPYFHDIQGLTKLHIQLKAEASPKEFYNNEKPDRYKISRESFVLSPYHPKIVLSPHSEFEETEIQLNNFWQRRKMF